MATELQQRSPAVEDYLKAIYSLTAAGDSASTNDLAARLGVSTGSVSAMVKKLDDESLVEHAPYRGVELTDEGRNVALRVLRRHRLIELFLARSLDMPWEDLHDEAEILEHAMSDELIELIARRLGDPQFDPHGDPIPARDLTIAQRATESLAELQPGETGLFVRVSDSNSEMLRYLTEQGIAIGARVEMIERQPFDGPCTITIDGAAHTLGMTLARAMQIDRDA
jgi:DtxR family Mn-dependent transcriptional regulator